MQLTASQRLAAEQSVFVVLVTARDDWGRLRYCYVAVAGDRLEAFKEALSRGDVIPNEYGKILAAGYGLVPYEVRKNMGTQYGCLQEGGIPLMVVKT